MKYLFLECELKANSVIQVTEKADINYIVNVLRFKKDQEVLLLDGNGNYSESKIILAHKKGVEIQTTNIDSAKKQDSQLNLYFGIPNKLPKLELILKMGTEIGVNNFYPLITEYSQVQSLGKLDRLNQIIKSAASQSESKFLAKLHDAQKIKNIENQNLNVFVCRKDTENLIEAEPKSQNIVIGPEGGFSESDIEILSTNNACSFYNLGPKILRLETASLLALGIVMLKFNK